MRFVMVLVVIVAGIVGAGFYRGWFQMTSDGSTDKPNVTLTVDKDKIQEDKQKALDKARSGQKENHPAVTPAPAEKNQD
jgi:hypothetical protein